MPIVTDGIGILPSIVRTIQIRTAENILDFVETDQVDPAGRWRFRLDGDKVYLERSTAAGWATDEDWLIFDKANNKITAGKIIQLGDGKAIELEETLETDHTISGITCVGTAGENLVFPNVCYLKSADGKFWKAKADAAGTTFGIMALATATIASGASGVFLLIGFVRDDNWNWTKTEEIYVSEATAGAITQTAPSASTNQIRQVGNALTADIMWFAPAPDMTIAEVS